MEDLRPLDCCNAGLRGRVCLFFVSNSLSVISGTYPTVSSWAGGLPRRRSLTLLLRNARRLRTLLPDQDTGTRRTTVFDRTGQAI